MQTTSLPASCLENQSVKPLFFLVNLFFKTPGENRFNFTLSQRDFHRKWRISQNPITLWTWLALERGNRFWISNFCWSPCHVSVKTEFRFLCITDLDCEIHYSMLYLTTLFYLFNCLVFAPYYRTFHHYDGGQHYSGGGEHPRSNAGCCKTFPFLPEEAASKS